MLGARLTGFVLLPLGAADSGGELGVTREAVNAAVPVSPVVGVAAEALPAVGSRQGQRGVLRRKARERKTIHLTEF